MSGATYPVILSLSHHHSLGCPLGGTAAASESWMEHPTSILSSLGRLPLGGVITALPTNAPVHVFTLCCSSHVFPFTWAVIFHVTDFSSQSTFDRFIVISMWRVSGCHWFVGPSKEYYKCILTKTLNLKWSWFQWFLAVHAVWAWKALLIWLSFHKAGFKKRKIHTSA